MEYVDLLKKVKNFFCISKDLITVKYQIFGVSCFDLIVSETLTGSIIADIKYNTPENKIEAEVCDKCYFGIDPEKFFEELNKISDTYNKFVNALTELDKYEREEGEEGTERYL